MLINGEDGASYSDIGGFAMVPHWLLMEIEQPISLKVWCVLHRYAVAEHQPSIARIAELCKCSEPTVRRSLKELVIVGAVVIRQRWGINGVQESNDYFLHLASPRHRKEVLGSLVEGITDEGEGRVSNSAPLLNTNNNNLENNKKTDVAAMLETVALANKAQPDLIDPGKWWEIHEDPLVRAIARVIEAVPKFYAGGMPEVGKILDSAKNIRLIAPDDEAVLYELNLWKVYNQDEKVKGGGARPLQALGNWMGKKRGGWAVERARRSTRSRQNNGRPGDSSIQGSAERMLKEAGLDEPTE